MVGPQEDSPSMPDAGFAVGPHCMLLKARISTPVLCPISRNSVALKLAPSEGPEGQMVAHFPPGVQSSPPSTAFVMPWTLLTPQ